MKKLTPTERGQLIRRAKAGASSRELAAEFGVDQSTAAKIVRKSLEPEAQAEATAKLRAIVDDESMPAELRLQAAQALLESASQPTGTQGSTGTKGKPEWWDDPNGFSDDPAECARFFELAKERRAAAPRMYPMHPMRGDGAASVKIDLSSPTPPAGRGDNTSIKNDLSVPAPTPPPAPAPPKLTREQKIAQIDKALAEAQAAGNQDRVQMLLGLQAKYSVRPSSTAAVSQSAWEKAQAAEAAKIELKKWAKDAERRLDWELYCGTPESAEAVRVEMRSRGVRPIGDDDSYWPAPELKNIDMPNDGQALTGRRPALGGGIIEWTSTGWKTWLGDE